MKKYCFVCIFLLFIFIIYLSCMSPSVNSGDSGELITTSIILGIAHSPGYPLFSLLGKIFSVLVPFSNYAYRVNLMNVFFSLLITLTLGLTSCYLFENDNKKKYISFILIATLLFSESFFRNTVQTEVFILNAFFCIIILVLSVLYQEHFYHKWLIVSFIFGLALSNHHTIVLLVPSLVFLFFKENKKISLKFVGLCLFLFSLGLTPYFLLPLRSKKNPGLDWGNTERIENLYKVLLRKDYGTFQLTVDNELKRSVTNIFKQFKRFYLKTVNDIGLVILVFGLFGFFIIYKQDIKLGMFLLITYIFCGPVFILFANLPFSALYDGIMERFYILPNAVIIVSSIICLKYYKSYLNIVLLVLFINSFYLLYKNFNICNYRSYFLNYDYGVNILRSILPSGILFMDGGDDTFYTLSYLKYANKKRLDIDLHDRGGVVFKNIYGDDFRKLSRSEKEKRRVEVEKSFIRIRPVYYSTFNKNILEDEYRLVPVGILYQVDDKKNVIPKNNLFFEICSLRSIYQKYFDYRSNALVPVYDFMFAFNLENIKQKQQLLKYLYFSYPDVDWLTTNISRELHDIAYSYFVRNEYMESREVYKLLSYLNPNDMLALLNFGVVSERLNDIKSAYDAYYMVLSKDKKNVNAYYNLAVLCWHRGDLDGAIKYFEEILKIDPKNFEASKYIEKAKKLKLDGIRNTN